MTKSLYLTGIQTKKQPKLESRRTGSSPTTERCYSKTWELNVLGGGGVPATEGLLYCPQSQQRPQIISQHGSNSPLCNSSPIASTAVLEEKFVCVVFFFLIKRYFGLSGLQCKCVFWWCLSMNACETWRKQLAKTCGRRARLSKSSRMRQVRDKGTSTTSWSSFVGLMMAWIGDQDVIILSSEALTLKNDNSYYNLRQHTNYFVLVPGMIGKTLVGGWCSTQSNLRCI